MSQFDRGSFLADAGYDIRVTARCLRADMHTEPATPLELLGGVPIIRGLCGKHSSDPSFVDTVGPAAGARTLGVLQYGEHHRGAVWHDVPNNAFWLCAYRKHRSGAPDDAFPYFISLLEDGDIYPDDADRVRLYSDRAERLIDALPADADRLRERALAEPGREIGGKLGPVAVHVVVVEVLGVRELWVAVKMLPFDHRLLQAVLMALGPSDRVWDDWRPENSLPTGGIDPSKGEVAYSCLLD